MDATAVNSITHDLLVTGMLLATPAVVVSLIVGLAIAIMQTLTSIQEQTLTFAPRIVAVGVVLMLTGPWTIRVLSSFTLRMMHHFVEAGR
ncbi:MAG: flagellar biosynthetic protein FliQ [Planctomycetaceae bacterium]|nr:flagellar biosynthetic protein FliQ [Planctomycetaceae bacterium]